MSGKDVMFSSKYHCHRLPRRVAGFMGFLREWIFKMRKVHKNQCKGNIHRLPILWYTKVGGWSGVLTTREEFKKVHIEKHAHTKIIFPSSVPLW